jgi:conjugal transfer pilus assembly protein TrbC
VRSEVLISFCALAFASIALARQPTELEVESAKQQVRQPTEAEVEAAKRKYRQPAELEIERAAAWQVPVNTEAIPMPKGNVEVEALARRYEANRQAFEGDRGPMADAPALLVFVTLAMPEPTLKLVIDQAARARAVLVLRGLEHASIRRTAAHVRQLIGQEQVEWLIDPQAFDRYGVEQAPTFVLVKAGAQASDCARGSCIAPEAFASVTGDVSIAYALEAIARRAPRFQPETRLFLDRMRP